MCRKSDFERVLRALEWLKPGGTLASIVGGAALENRWGEEFADGLAVATNGDWLFEPLPDGSFRKRH